MAVVYISGELQIHGLNIKSQEELTEFENKIKQAIREIHLDLSFEDDVVFEADEKAGNFGKE